MYFKYFDSFKLLYNHNRTTEPCKESFKPNLKFNQKQTKKTRITKGTLWKERNFDNINYQIQGYVIKKKILRQSYNRKCIEAQANRLDKRAKKETYIYTVF